MNEQNLILNLSMDEAPGSTTAIDSSPSAAHGTVIGDADFGEGHNGYALHCLHGGHCDVARDICNFSQNFSLMAWICGNAGTDDMPVNIGLIIRYGSGPNDYIQRWYGTEPRTWTNWAIVRNGSQVTVYAGFVAIDTLTLPAAPTGLALMQDYCSNDYAEQMNIDEVMVFQRALTQEELIESQNASKRITYSIGGVPFEELGIGVSGSKGLLERPKMKTPLKLDYPDYHGEVVDLKDKRLEPRTISLECWCKANGSIDFINKLNRLYGVLDTDGTARLVVGIHPARPLIYEVYCPDGMDPNKRWNEKLMVGTFTLKLREPEPQKRILAFSAIDSNQRRVTLNLQTEQRLSVSWGDGQITDEVTSGELTHTYQQQGSYHILIAGVIDKISSMTTNATVIWTKL